MIGRWSSGLGFAVAPPVREPQNLYRDSAAGSCILWFTVCPLLMLASFSSFFASIFLEVELFFVEAVGERWIGDEKQKGTLEE